jgi:DNA replication protein DnaC
MDDDLDQLLRNLRLTRIREILDREIDRATRRKKKPSYSEFLARLLREQYQYQRERSMLYRIKQAKLPEQWSLESFPFDRQPGVHEATIREIAELDFIPRAQNLVFIGDTGVGKTGLALSILRKALENGHRGLFVKAQDLFDDMYQSLADRSSRRLVSRMMNMDVLLIDEMGYLNLRPEQSNIFFKLMEERYHRKSTIITTNLEYEAWYDFLGNKQMVKALLDRLRHHCQTITIEGPSLRDPAES